MAHRFAVGDRVIVQDERLIGLPVGTVGTVMQTFPRVPEMYDVQFDDYAGLYAAFEDGLAPAPPPDVPAPDST